MWRVLLIGVISLSIAAPLLVAQTNYAVGFSVTAAGYVTVYLSGPPGSDVMILHYGIEGGPQLAWTQVFDEEMSWNGRNFSVTIGPFENGTWISWVFYDNTTGSWVNYDGHPFWNWNLQVNPTDVGRTYATVLQNGSILITAVGRAPDDLSIRYSVTAGPQAGSALINASTTPMNYDPLSGNYTVLLGPFASGTLVQWVYYDSSTGRYYRAPDGAYFAIRDVYSPILFLGANYTNYVFLTSQSIGVTLTLDDLEPKPTPMVLSFVLNSTHYNTSLTLEPGLNVLNFSLPNYLPQGIFHPELDLYQGGDLVRTASLPPLYVLNTTGKEPLSFVLVWNMHQPLYVAPNGTWEEPWIWLHTGQDFPWRGETVGSYELQALLLEHFNVSVTIDFTPVLLYQWEDILHGKGVTFSSDFGIDLEHDVNATNFTLSLYRQLVREGRVEVLTVPLYHPLQPLMLSDGWYSDVLAQILMGENITYTVFGVRANGIWTPEMAFDMSLVSLYNQSGISYTVLDQEAFLPHSTLVKGNLNPDQPFIVENNVGQRTVVLFRNTTLSNEFGYYFFNQPPQLTAEDLIHQLAAIYMRDPGGVVTVALDGENPLIFNPSTGPADLYAIYQALSEQGQWIVTQTIGEAVAAHRPTSVLTNLPESSWDLNLDYWNNGYPGKEYIWGNVSEAREYLVAYTTILGKTVSPQFPLPFDQVPNSTDQLDTLWNYLYVAEGSDWTWQTGPPADGPSWFMQQALLYSRAVMNGVESAFHHLWIKGISVEGRELDVTVDNALGSTVSVNLVISAGGENRTYPITLDPGVDHVMLGPLELGGKDYRVTLCAPVTPQEVGAAVKPIGSCGFPITSRDLPAVSEVEGGGGLVGLPLIVAAVGLGIASILALRWLRK